MATVGGLIWVLKGSGSIVPTAPPTAAPAHKDTEDAVLAQICKHYYIGGTYVRRLPQPAGKGGRQVLALPGNGNMAWQLISLTVPHALQSGARTKSWSRARLRGLQACNRFVSTLRVNNSRSLPTIELGNRAASVTLLFVRCWLITKVLNDFSFQS